MKSKSQELAGETQPTGPIPVSEDPTKLDVGHLHVLHREKVPPSHLTLILRNSVSDSGVSGRR